MTEFIVKKIVNSDLNAELQNIGFDEAYRAIAVDKYKFFNIKIYNLTLPQANILKQTALSNGSDCAVHKDILTAKIDKTDCILGTSVAQLKKICANLSKQQFSMPQLAQILQNQFLQNNVIETKIVGILNITENSFSDGGEFFQFEDAKNRLLEMIEEGADIIDIGAESTKPYSKPVSAELQLERLLPMLEFINYNNIKIPVSIDTRSAFVAQKCIEKGVKIINDVSGFDFDFNMVDVIAKNDVKIIIQHSLSTPATMQENPQYDNLIDDIYIDLKNKIEIALKKGIKLNNIIIDLGIGFGKTKEHNFELIRRFEEFSSLNCPIMLGISRKSFLEVNEKLEKDILTLCLNTILIEHNINYIRVHNVKMHRKVLEMIKKYNGD